MKRVLLDQGLPFQAAVILRAEGWEAIPVREIGLNEAEDSAILDYAVKEKRTVVTLDRDFPQILALSSASTPSIVLIRQERLRAAPLVALLQRVWIEHGQSLDAGCVLPVGAYGTRIRSLPLT
jgi:predicted nuclease of predicted toxin-antitoxin system